MTSLRHQTRISEIRLDTHRLTKRERVKLNLPPAPVRRERDEPRFPARPEDYAWYVLQVAPQRERRVVERLDDAGFVGFNPTEIVEVRQCRRLGFRRVRRARAMLTSYVLFGHPLRPGRSAVRRDLVPIAAGGGGALRRAPNRVEEVMVADVPWPDVLGIPEVIDAVRLGGEPARLGIAEVRMLRARHERLGVTRDWAPVLQGTVLICNGMWTGRVGRVERLHKGEAWVRIAGAGVLAGLADPVRVPETWLDRAEL